DAARPLRNSLVPAQRLLPPIVAPEQFAGRGREARGTEQAEPLRFIGFRPQPRFDLVGLGRFHGLPAVEGQYGHRVDYGGWGLDRSSRAEFRPEHGKAEILSPLLVEPDQRDTSCEQTVLGKRIGTAERQR